MIDYTGKVIGITGGTGSFGQTLVTHLLKSDASEIRVLSRDEAKQDAMRNTFRDSRLKFFVGDTRDSSSLPYFLSGVNFVFHAAALKQVPTGEFFPLEVVKTNVLGSDNVLNLAIKEQVECVVCLSTDKAVYPINAMGMSKALMEKNAIATARVLGQGRTRICVTRYGNVMLSRGSVIPLFIRQIEAQEPLTITNPNMTRFLMSLEQSIDLVEHAFSEGNNGDLFVRKAPAATIQSIGESLQRVLGRGYGTRIIGARHGEKLFESLLSAEELVAAKEEEDYFRVAMDARGLDYSLYFDQGSQVEFPEPYTSHGAERLEGPQLDTLLEETLAKSGYLN
ncbi:polysaccharide biosynthesis protein [Aquiluna sp.]|nr:polysaccharide biosynthesis protein [Aquiluna sp.]